MSTCGLTARRVSPHSHLPQLAAVGPVWRFHRMRLASGEDLHHIPHGTLLGEPGMSRQRDHTPPTWACQMTTTIAATEWRPPATASCEAHVLLMRNTRLLKHRTAHRLLTLPSSLAHESVTES